MKHYSGHIINCTGHDIYYLDKEIMVTFPTALTPTYCHLSRLPDFTIETDGTEELSNIQVSVMVNRTVYDAVIDPPPPPQPGVWYIVSRVTADYLRREDLLVPDQLIRDEKNHVIGCKNFRQYTSIERGSDG